MSSYNEELDRVMKMARKEYTGGPISVADMHPSLRFTRLGAHLRHTANEGYNDDISALARTILLSDHDKPLNTFPLYMLKDALLGNPEHDLFRKFNWDTLPGKVVDDEKLRDRINRHNEREYRIWPRTLIIPSDLYQPYSSAAEKLSSDFLSENPHMDKKSLFDSASRLQTQRNNNDLRYRHTNWHDEQGLDKYGPQTRFLYDDDPERY